MKKGKFSTQDITLSAIAVVVIVLCSWLSVPTAVPFTMQSFGVILISVVLGRRQALWALLGYCLLGMIGLPVFAGFRSGIAVLAGPTGGYILGLFAFPFIIGSFSEGKQGKYQFFAAFSGLLVMYIVGTLWYSIVYTKGDVGILPALSMCVLPFIIPDIIKCILALICAKKIKKVLILVDR